MPSLKKISFEPSIYNTDSLIRQHPILTATAFTGLLGLGYYWWQSETPPIINKSVKKPNGHIFAKWSLQNVVIAASGWIKSLSWYNYFINKNQKKSANNQ